MFCLGDPAGGRGGISRRFGHSTEHRFGLCACASGPGEGQTVQSSFEVRELSDGTRALPVFTSLEQLVAVLGPAQPWALLPLRAVRALMGVAGVPYVLVDPNLGAEVWRWTEEGLIDLAGAAR